MNMNILALTRESQLCIEERRLNSYLSNKQNVNAKIINSNLGTVTLMSSPEHFLRFISKLKYVLLVQSSKTSSSSYLYL